MYVSLPRPRMDYLIYLLYRTVTGFVAVLPLTLGFRLGQFGGWLGTVSSDHTGG